MKARVKATGEIVDVTNLFDDGTAEIGEKQKLKQKHVQQMLNNRGEDDL